MFSRWFKPKPAPANSSEEVELARLVGDIEQRPWAQLSKQERVVLAVWQLEAEVNNGGFDQYFRNSAGEHAPWAIEALEEIGAPNCAAIVRRAVRLVVGEVGEWQKARGAFLAASPDLEGALETLDQEFYRYPDDLERRLSEYLGGWRSGS